MTPPGTFERVYDAIKQRLRDGFYLPGDRLEPALLAEEFNASVTPVRDALHRLTGERMVEAAPRHDGFRVPTMTESVVRQLYAWHRDLLLLAVSNHRASAFAEEIVVVDGRLNGAVHKRQNALFMALARCAGNAEHAMAVEALNNRLEPVQRFEEMFLDGTEVETSQIVRALQAHDRQALRQSLIRYHRRRQKIVPELLRAVLDTGPIVWPPKE